MSIEEVARAIQYLRMVGLSEAQISDFMIYIATGFGMQKTRVQTEQELKNENHDQH